METSQKEIEKIDWLKISDLIICSLKKKLPLVPVDEIEASSFVGLAVAKSIFNRSDKTDIENNIGLIYRIGLRRTIDDLRDRKLIDRANAVNKKKEVVDSDIGRENKDWSIFDLVKHSEDEVGDLEREDFWKEVTKRLSKEEERIILLYYRDGITMKKIGVLLDCTEGRISQIVKRTLLKIKKRFDENEYTWNEFLS
jgi:RNA polymerase sigma factor (sigma-70 family)